MNKWLRLLFLLPLWASAGPASAAVNVFACEPEWAALTTELAGSRAKAFIASTGLQDPHRVQARPSLIAAGRAADLLVCAGAELEVGWLPPILAQSGNPRIQLGQVGHLEVANHVPVIERPPVIDRSLGDLHPVGNPHVVYDPRNILLAAGEISKRLMAIDPSGAAEYGSRLKAFTERWEAAMKKWQQEVAPLKGVPVIEQHKEVTYLFNWIGMPLAGALEPKPGVEPTSGHLEELLEQQKQHPAKLIVRVTYRSPEAGDWLAKRANIPAVEVASTVGGTPAAKDLFSLYDDTISRMLAALKSEKAASR
jgi:zinc/manganese transport system substrate-binding protein